MSLVYCIDVYDLDGLSPEGTFVSPYILRRDKVTSKVSNLVQLQYSVLRTLHLADRATSGGAAHVYP